ncbi:MAG TPA: glycosyltransferase [bacterium]
MALLHVVCPVYHEQDNVPALWREVQAHFRFPFQVHFVYDREDDPTVPVIRALQAQAPEQVALIPNPAGGALNALKTGLAAMPSGAPVLVMMADLSDDLVVVSAMLAAWERGAKVVVASRYMRGGRQLGGPLVKRMLSRLAGVSLYWLRRLPVHDATNNFRLYDGSFLKTVTVESHGGFELALELTVKAARAGLPIAELPATWRDRSAGTSRFKLMKWLPRYLRWYFLALKPR